MTHSYHQSLPNYVEDAVFHSGCPECEHRAGLRLDAVRFLDDEHLRVAMKRALVLRSKGARAPSDPDDGRMTVDPLELPFLRDLAQVQDVGYRLGWELL